MKNLQNLPTQSKSHMLSLHNWNENFQVTSNISQNHTKNWSSLHTLMLLLTESEPNCTSLQAHAECDMGLRCDCMLEWPRLTITDTNHYQLYVHMPVAHIPTPTQKFSTILPFTLHHYLFCSLIPNKSKGQYILCLGSYLTCNLYTFVKNKFVS